MYEAGVTFGNLYNFNEKNGYLIYDDPDVIKYKIGAELKYNFNYNLNAYFSYSYENRERKYFTYSLSKAVLIPQSNNSNYNINSLLLGVNYVF